MKVLEIYKEGEFSTADMRELVYSFPLEGVDDEIKEAHGIQALHKKCLDDGLEPLTLKSVVGSDTTGRKAMALKLLCLRGRPPKQKGE